MLRPPVDATADEPVMVVRRRIQGVLDSIDRTLSDAAPRPSTEDPLHAQRATAGATAIPPELPARPPTTASKPLRGGDSPGTSFGEWSELTDPSPVRPLYMDRHNHAIPTVDEGVKLPTQPLPPASVGEAVLPPRPAPMTAAAAAPHPRRSPTYTPADVGDVASRRWQRAEIVSTAAPREATPTREAPRRPPTSQQRLLSPQRSAPSPLRRPSNSPPSFLDADENNTDLLFPRRAPREVSDEVMQSPPRTTPYSSTMAKLMDDPRFGYNNNTNNNYINAPRVPRGVGTTATLRTPSMDPMEERISFVEEAEQRLEAQRAAAEKLAQQRRAHTATAQRAQQQQHALLRARAAGDSRERFAALLGHAERVQQEAQEWLSEGGVVPAEVMAVRHHARELDRARSLFEYVKRAVAMTELPEPSPLPRLEMLRPAPAPHTAAEYPKFQPKNFTNDALVADVEDDDDEDDDAIMLTPPRSRRVSSVMNAPTAGLLAECINSEGGSTPGRMPPPSPGAEADLADAAIVMNDDDDLDVDGSASYSESESEQETEPYRGAPHRGGSSASASASSPRSPSSTRQHTRFAIPVPSQGRQASPPSSKPAAPTTPPSNTEAALTPSSAPTAATPSRVGGAPSAPRTTSPAKTVAPPKAAPAVAASPSPTTPRFKAPAGVPPSATNTPASTPTQSPNKQPQTTPERTPRDDIRNAVARAYRQTAQRLLQAGLPLKVRLASGAAVPAHLRWIPAQHELCFTTVRMMSGNTNNNNNNNKKDGMKSSAPGAASPLRSTSPSSRNRSHRPSAISPTRSGSPAHAQPPILHTRTNTGISSAQSAPPTPPLRQVSFNCADHRTYSILLPTTIAANSSNNNNNPPRPTSSPQRSQSPATSQRSAVPPSASPAKKMVPPSAVHGKKMMVPPTSSPAKKMVASASPPTSSVAKTMPPNPSPSKKMIMAPPTASPPAKMMAPPGTTPVKKMMMAAPTSAPASSTRAVASPPRAASPSSSPPTAAPSTIREDHRVLWDRDVGHGKLLLPTSFFTPAISSSRNKKRSPSSGRTSTAEWGGRAACQALRRCGCRMFAEMPPISTAPMYRLYVLVARQALRAPCVVPAPTTTTTTTTPADTRPPATNSSTQDSLLAHWPLAHRLSTGEAVIVVELNSRVDYILCSIALSARSGRAATYGEMLWRIAAQRLREAHARSGTRNSQQR